MDSATRPVYLNFDERRLVRDALRVVADGLIVRPGDATKVQLFACNYTRARLLETANLFDEFNPESTGDNP